MFFVVFLTKFPEVPINICEDRPTALKSLVKHHRHGRSGWISEMDLLLLKYYVDAIDPDLDEIFDIARFDYSEKIVNE
jgi:hypothetical protein